MVAVRLAFNDDHIKFFVIVNLILLVCILSLPKDLVICFVSSFRNGRHSFATLVAIIPHTSLSEVVLFSSLPIGLLYNHVRVFINLVAKRSFINWYVIDIREVDAVRTSID